MLMRELSSSKFSRWPGALSQTIGAEPLVHKFVVAVAVGGGMHGNIGSEVGERNRGAGNGGSAGIMNGTENGAGLKLRTSGRKLQGEA